MSSDGHRKPGPALIAIGAIWGFLGSLIVSSDPYTLSDGIKAILVWPVFLFITPPGWFVLIRLWNWHPKKSSVLRQRRFRKGPPPLRPPRLANGERITWAPPLVKPPSSQGGSQVRTLAPPQLPPLAVFLPSPPPTRSSYVHTSNKPFSGPTNNPQPGVVFEAIMDQSSRRQLASRFGWICQLCLERIPDFGWDYQNPHPRRLSIDHIIPVSHGGRDDLSNLQPTHAQCNTEKGSRLISNNEFRQWKMERDQQARIASISRPSSSDSSSSRPWRGFERAKSRPLRPGKWSPGDDVISDLNDDFDEANLSDEQRRRALDFLRADHPYPLMEKCQRGHLFTLENTYFSYDDEMRVGRQCRECRRRRNR